MMKNLGIDKNLKFDEHIKDICSKARSKCFALSRIRKFLTVDKARLLYNAFILSNFSYCPLIWMFCSKSDNTLISNTHKKALKADLHSGQFCGRQKIVPNKHTQ